MDSFRHASHVTSARVLGLVCSSDHSISCIIYSGDLYSISSVQPIYVVVQHLLVPARVGCQLNLFIPKHSMGICASHPSCYWSFLDCASFLALSILVLIGLVSSALSSSFLIPNTCPISPPGFGTGHSRLCDIFSSICSRLIFSSLVIASLASSSAILRLRRLRFSPVGSAESANVRGSTGHGIKCGAATTRNETMSVVVNNDVVMRDRG